MLGELRQSAPRTGDTPHRLLGWLAKVHYEAPKAVGIADGENSD